MLIVEIVACANNHNHFGKKKMQMNKICSYKIKIFGLLIMI